MPLHRLSCKKILNLAFTAVDPQEPLTNMGRIFAARLAVLLVITTAFLAAAALITAAAQL